MQKQKINYDAFIPIGVCFMGSGVVFLAAVNPGVGAGLMGVGVAWMIIGLKNKAKK
ncbi:hypothetical protein ACFLY8_00385 [Halobacteriota archaeon]